MARSDIWDMAWEGQDIGLVLVITVIMVAVTGFVYLIERWVQRRPLSDEHLQDRSHPPATESGVKPPPGGGTGRNSPPGVGHDLPVVDDDRPCRDALDRFKFMGAEDHDFAEIDHAYVVGKKLQVSGGHERVGGVAQGADQKRLAKTQTPPARADPMQAQGADEEQRDGQAEYEPRPAHGQVEQQHRDGDDAG